MTDEEDYRQAMNAEIQAKLAAQGEGPVASPSVPYIKYILMDDEKAPRTLPPELVNAVFDRELTLTFLDEFKQNWLLQQHMRATNMFMQGRPMMTNTHRQSITLSVLPAKLMVKLSRSSIPRSRQSLTNERILEATQIVTKQVSTSGGPSQVSTGSRWRIFGRGKKKEATPK